MTSTEITDEIEETLARLPERMSGNEANQYVAERLQNLMSRDRESVIEALKSYLTFQVAPEKRRPEDAPSEARIWMALDLAVRLSLVELQPEISSLLSNVLKGKALDKLDAKSVYRYLQKLKTISS